MQVFVPQRYSSGFCRRVILAARLTRFVGAAHEFVRWLGRKERVLIQPGEAEQALVQPEIRAPAEERLSRADEPVTLPGERTRLQQVFSETDDLLPGRKLRGRQARAHFRLLCLTMVSRLPASPSASKRTSSMS